MVRFKILNYFSKGEIKFLKNISDDYMKAFVVITRTYRDKQNSYYYKLDKAGNPEIGHFIRLSDSFLKPPFGALVCHDEDIILKGMIVGLLHDVVEDGLLTLEDLRFLEFEEDIINTVKIISRDKTKFASYDDYITSILESGNLVAIWVKYYDIFDNNSKQRICLLSKPWQEKLTKKYSKQLPRIIEKLEQSFGQDIYKREREIV